MNFTDRRTSYYDPWLKVPIVLTYDVRVDFLTRKAKAAARYIIEKDMYSVFFSHLMYIDKVVIVRDKRLVNTRKGTKFELQGKFNTYDYENKGTASIDINFVQLCDTEYNDSEFCPLVKVYFSRHCYIVRVIYKLFSINKLDTLIKHTIMKVKRALTRKIKWPTTYQCATLLINYTKKMLKIKKTLA